MYSMDKLFICCFATPKDVQIYIHIIKKSSEGWCIITHQCSLQDVFLSHTFPLLQNKKTTPTAEDDPDSLTAPQINSVNLKDVACSPQFIQSHRDRTCR